MIDYEVKIFNRVHAVVAPMCADRKFVSTVISKAPPAFPAASLIEMDNRTVERAQTSTPKENRALITYQLDVYDTTKSGCKKVFAAADEAMIAMNFSRMSGLYIDNSANTKVFRYTARYEAEVDADGNLYRRRQ